MDEKKPTTSTNGSTPKKDTKDKPKAKPKKKKSSVDKTTMLFYIILLVGILVFVIIMIKNSSKQRYITTFGDQIQVAIDLKGDKFTLSIYADAEEPSTQEGTFTKNEETSIYEVVFDDKSKAQFTINEETETLLFEYNKSKIEFKKGDFEKKTTTETNETTTTTEKSK